MEEFDASDIVARVVEGEAPHLRHSCIPSTYKGVSEQVNIAHYSDSYLFLFLDAIQWLTYPCLPVRYLITLLDFHSA